MVSGVVKSNKGFYIGDICYVLDNDIYHNIWGKKNGYREGEIAVNDTLSFVVGSTAYGDGCYMGDNGIGFPVDAGVIGVVPLELVSDITEANRLGYVLDGATMAEYDNDDGYITISLYSPNGYSDLTINTRDDSEY